MAIHKDLVDYKLRIKMKNKIMTGECESTYHIQFDDVLVSEELPEYCPFCGSKIEELIEELEDDDEEGGPNWD